MIWIQCKGKYCLQHNPTILSDVYSISIWQPSQICSKCRNYHMLSSLACTCKLEGMPTYSICLIVTSYLMNSWIELLFRFTFPRLVLKCKCFSCINFLGFLTILKDSFFGKLCWKLILPNLKLYLLKKSHYARCCQTNAFKAFGIFAVFTYNILIISLMNGYMLHFSAKYLI